MILTPTYRVFDLYLAQQDATMVPIDVQSETYEFAGYRVPAFSASASINIFDQLNNRAPKAFHGAQLSAEGLTVRLLKMSVVALEVR